VKARRYLLNAPESVDSFCLLKVAKLIGTNRYASFRFDYGTLIGCPCRKSAADGDYQQNRVETSFDSPLENSTWARSKASKSDLRTSVVGAFMPSIVGAWIRN